MAPSTPSDAQPPVKPDTSPKPGEHSHNLLDLVSTIKKNALAPAVNSFAIEPVNAGVNVLNGLSEAGTWVVNKVSGSKVEAPRVGKVAEIEVARAEPGSAASYSQQIFATAGSFLTYAVAGKFAGKILRTAGELTPIELEIKSLKIGSMTRAVAQDARVATVLGATAYAGLKDPKQGESRFSNLASTAVGFTFFEAGNSQLVDHRASALFRFGQRYTVGSLGGVLQTNTALLIQEHRTATRDEAAASSISGGLLNALMPAGRHIVDGAIESRAVRGLPHMTEATARLHIDAVRALPKGEALQPGSWADPNMIKSLNRVARADLHTRVQVEDNIATHIDQTNNVVHLAKGDEPLNALQELAHRKIFKEPAYEAAFQAHARELHSNDPSDPRNINAKEMYVQTRVDQEVAARKIQNEEAVKVGSSSRVSVDGNEIKAGYGARFQAEADEFVRTGGKTRPVIDHATSPHSYAFADAANEVGPGAANQNRRPENRVDLSIVAGTDGPAARAALEHVRNWEIQRDAILRSNNSPQDRPQNNLYQVLRDRLQATGLAVEGWSILPTATGSPLDQVGCDFAMVNKKTRQVIFLDGTQNADKLANPGGHNVSEIRRDWVIGFDNKLIDIMGKLRVDDDGQVGRNAREFKDVLDEQLREVAKAGSPITIDMLPSHMRQESPLETQKQVEDFRSALLKRAQEHSPLSVDRDQLQNYVRDLGRGVTRYNELTLATKPSPTLEEAVSRNSDRVVLDYVLSKLNIKEFNNGGRPDNPGVTRMTKDGRVTVTVDGTVYDGGHLKEAITASRGELRRYPERLRELLQKDRAVMAKMAKDHQTIDQVMRKVQEMLVESREVDNGMLGTTNLGLDLAVRNRIASSGPESLATGIPVEKVVKEKPVEAAKPTAFTAEQKAEIPKMAATMSEFGLRVQDGVDPHDLTAFIEMYKDSPTTPKSVVELCDQYLADADKPVAEQRLIPKLKGALVAAQMRAEHALEPSQNAVAPANALKLPNEITSRAKKSGGKSSSSDASSGADAESLPFEQMKEAFERMHELGKRAELTDEEQNQLEALRAFHAHVLEASTRSAVRNNMEAGLSHGLNFVASGGLVMAAISKWYRDNQDESETTSWHGTSSS